MSHYIIFNFLQGYHPLCSVLCTQSNKASLEWSGLHWLESISPLPLVFYIYRVRVSMVSGQCEQRRSALLMYITLDTVEIQLSISRNFYTVYRILFMHFQSASS